MHIVHDQLHDILTVHLAIVPVEEWRDHPTDTATILGYAGDLLCQIKTYRAEAGGSLPVQVNEQGNPLKALRLSLGLTQTEFALVTGIRRENISLVENGKHNGWNPEKAAKHALKRVQTFLQHRTLGSVAPDYEKRLERMGE
jgi:DNA-binding transcriptional regulator YiaG